MTLPRPAIQSWKNQVQECRSTFCLFRQHLSFSFFVSLAWAFVKQWCSQTLAQWQRQRGRGKGRVWLPTTTTAQWKGSTAMPFGGMWTSSCQKIVQLSSPTKNGDFEQKFCTVSLIKKYSNDRQIRFRQMASPLDGQSAKVRKRRLLLHPVNAILSTLANLPISTICTLFLVVFSL